MYLETVCKDWWELALASANCLEIDAGGIRGNSAKGMIGKKKKKKVRTRGQLCRRSLGCLHFLTCPSLSLCTYLGRSLDPTVTSREMGFLCLWCFT